MSGGGDTIVALSSGSLPSGVAVLRFSGPACRAVVAGFVGELSDTQKLVLRRFVAPSNGDLLDEGLIVWFAGPKSFTGEDCVEFHIHGSQAVVARFLDESLKIDGVRLALAGEFVQRAFEAGRLDALEVEAIADLLDARTEAQRSQAVAQMSGSSSDILLSWRAEIIDLRAHIEACLDFSDEEDVPNVLPVSFDDKLGGLIQSVEAQVRRAHVGEMVRDGIVVAIVGAPNVGKSSLLNVLAARDVAIVSEEAGTTRDLLEVDLDIQGQAFRIIDSAGLRETESAVEAEGIKRARALIDRADIVLNLSDGISVSGADFEAGTVWNIRTKMDLEQDSVDRGYDLSLSCKTQDGIGELLSRLGAFASAHIVSDEQQIITRQRHLVELQTTLSSLMASQDDAMALEFRAEHLRLASDAIGRIVGLVNVEDVLDRLFAGFCIGK